MTWVADIEASRLHLEETRKKRTFTERTDAIIDDFREQFLLLNRHASEDLVRILATYHKAVVGELTAAGVFANPAVTDAEIAQIIASATTDLARAFQGYMQTSLVDSAELTMLRERELLKAVASDLPRKVQTALFTAVPVHYVGKVVAENLMQTTLGSGLELSQAVWTNAQLANSQVSGIVRTGLLRGDDVVDIAKDLEHVLVPQEDTLREWNRANAPRRLRNRISRSRRAGVYSARNTTSYTHLRVARTEIFRAQKAAHQINVMGLQRLVPFPVVNGMQWNLSNSHPFEDVCDVWSSTDDYELGAGVYPPDQLPPGHPQDLCYTTSVLMPPGQFAALMELRGDAVGSPALLGSLSLERGVAAFREVVEANGETIFGLGGGS
jgi:hypothetical protein